jgi:hypothetical protein
MGSTRDPTEQKEAGMELPLRKEEAPSPVAQQPVAVAMAAASAARAAARHFPVGAVPWKKQRGSTLGSKTPHW